MCSLPDVFAPLSAQGHWGQYTGCGLTPSLWKVRYLCGGVPAGCYQHRWSSAPGRQCPLGRGRPTAGQRSFCPIDYSLLLQPICRQRRWAGGMYGANAAGRAADRWSILRRQCFFKPYFKSAAKSCRRGHGLNLPWRQLPFRTGQYSCPPAGGPD